METLGQVDDKGIFADIVWELRVVEGDALMAVGGKSKVLTAPNKVVPDGHLGAVGRLVAEAKSSSSLLDKVRERKDESW